MIKVGQIVVDSITGFEGVAIARTEWLNGCVRITIQPQQLHEGKPIESQTFDQEQVEVVPNRAYQLPTQEPPKNRAMAATGGDRPAIGRAADPKR